MKNERFYHSRIFDYFKRFICIFSCFVLCLCIIPYNLVYAFNGTDNFDILYLTENPSHTVYSEGTSYCKIGQQYENVYCTTDFKYYFFLFNNGTTIYPVIVYDSSNPPLSTDLVKISSYSGGSPIWNTVDTSYYDNNSTYNLKSKVISSIRIDPSHTFYASVYTNFDSGLADIRSYIDNYNPLPNEGFEGTLIVPAGNVAYVQINGGDMELSAVMNSKSGLVMGGNPWANNARISYGVSDYPGSGTTFPLSGSNLIPWMKQAEGQDLLGRTRYAGYPRSDLSTSDNFIVIYNPACSSLASKGFDVGEDELNPSITAHFSKLVTYRIYPLTQSYNVQTNELTSESISDYDDYFNGTPDENGQFTETPSSPGMPSQAQPGGTGGLSDSSQSIGDYIRNITNILSNFVNNVIALIQVPISHIGQLIDSGSGFMSALRGLYAWLPVDIQGLVISALTVVIGIGVFKVFL